MYAEINPHVLCVEGASPLLILESLSSSVCRNRYSCGDRSIYRLTRQSLASWLRELAGRRRGDRVFVSVGGIGGGAM